MMIFIMTRNDLYAKRVAVPLDKVYSITQHDSHIEIDVRTGDVDNVGTETAPAIVPEMHSYRVEYSDFFAAAREMACFYYAARKGEKAYLFANEPEFFDVDESKGLHK